jgi:nucleoside-diphosphate-sugar epimerase/predicted dehydrogenase
MARAHARALRRTSTPVTITGVFDADDSTAEDFATTFRTTSFASIDTLLRDAKPEVVHICTTAGAHFDAARKALDGGAHVYVEKPFVETLSDANALLALAASKNRLICAGHQLLADPVYEALRRSAHEVVPFVRTESLLSFASPTVRVDAPPQVRAAQLLDVLPHPLYTLVAALEWMAPGARVTLVTGSASPDSLEGLFTAGGVEGRLHVSLVTRPVASTLSMTGANGTIVADFIRGSVTGIVNPGTTPIEKILNPALDGIRATARSLTGVARRLLTHGEYPGLAVLIDRFYTAVRDGGASPTSPEHLLRVVSLYEDMVAMVRAAAPAARATAPTARRAVRAGTPVVAVTGASGFLGTAVARKLADRGFRVRGIGRGPDPQRPDIHEWVRADVSRELPPAAFDGVYAVVHAAAATSGGFSAHQRHSVDGARRVVDAAAAAGVRRLVHISSISVVRPPRGYGEVQSESTPTADDAQTLGAYTWGKCASETLLMQRAAAGGIPVRVVRPAALTDRRRPELPGLAGKRLFGRWHLFLGRPSHAFAACDVDLAADAIAWYVECFDEAPPIVNLLDPSIQSRESLIRQLRTDGWRGRGVWVPISWLSFAVKGVQGALSIARGRKPAGPDVWQVLRPRRFDSAVSARVFDAMRRATPRDIPATDRESEPAEFATKDGAYA